MYLILVLQNDEISQQFSDKCVKKCKEARRLLSDISKRLLNADITVKELQMLDLHLSQAVKLFSTEVIETETNDQSFNLTKIVKKRKHELQKFKSYHSAVKTVLEYCKDMLKQGIYIYM